MSENDHLDAGLQYHSGTKHSYQSLRMNPHFLDWDNKPLLFKIYPTLEVTRLPTRFPRDAAAPHFPRLRLRVRRRKGRPFPILKLWRSCSSSPPASFAARNIAQGETFFRAAACTGALYEIELYVVCTDLPGRAVPGVKEPPGLAAGVYHFGVAEFGLRQLRAGDFRQTLVDATGGDPSVAHAPVTIICTGTYWRNAWKYHSRTYRHFGWDNGTILANLLAHVGRLESSRQGSSPGFVDSQVNALLGLDTKREVAFSLVPIGHMQATPPSSPPISPLELPIVPYSKRRSRLSRHAQNA